MTRCFLTITQILSSRGPAAAALGWGGRFGARPELLRLVFAAEPHVFGALFVLSITLGLRPGELRGLRWDHVDLGKCVIHVWRSARRGGYVKTPRSRRSLMLPKRAIAALRVHRKRQAAERLAAGEDWHDSNLVFCHPDGRPYTRDDLNWRFSKVTRRAGLGHWHAHEARHTAVSIMSKNGVPIQEISDTVSHKSTYVTETAYRHIIVPRSGAERPSWMTSSASRKATPVSPMPLSLD